MLSRLRWVALAALSATSVFAAPPGFENQTVLDQVMAGKIIVDDESPNNANFQFRVRAYFPKGTPRTFVQVVTEHEKLPTVFTEIKKGKTTFVSEDGTEFHSELEVEIKSILGTDTLYPLGIQKVTFGEGINAATKVNSTLANEDVEDLQSATEATTLHPWETGFLSETLVVVKMKKAVTLGGIVRREVRRRVPGFVEQLRTAVASRADAP